MAINEWILERKPTEVVDIKHDLIFTRIHGRLVMASANDEFTSTLLDENVEMKGAVDKLYKETFTKMIMHSYFTSGLNFVTNVNRMLKHCTEKRLMTISKELFKTILENGIKRRMPITWGKFSFLEPINAVTASDLITASAERNYLYTIKVPRPDSDEDASEIESHGEVKVS